MGNALDYGAEGTGVQVTVNGESEMVSVSIRNRGAAISSDQLNGIFGPMKRSKDAGPTASGSLGLGLYIADRIVNAHEGEIDVESSDSEGTTFTVRLPRKVRTEPVPG
jgi:signal transduction histidine kinase